MDYTSHHIPVLVKNAWVGRFARETILSRETIRKHLRHYKRDPQFQTSILVRGGIPKT
jgi:hypothetical protein